MTIPMRYAPDVRERAVRMVSEQEASHDSQWAAIKSIAPKIGCTPQTLRRWVQQCEVDSARRAGLKKSDRERLRALERENRELKRANEIRRYEPDAPAQVGRYREQKRLIFSNDQFDITITMSARTDDDRVDLLGQIFAPPSFNREACCVKLKGKDDLSHLADSDEKGRFSFRRLPVGEYRLTVTGPNFEITPPVVKCSF